MGARHCRCKCPVEAVPVKWLQVQDDEEEEDWWSIAGCIIARCSIAGVALLFTLYNLSCIGREKISFL